MNDLTERKSPLELEEWTKLFVSVLYDVSSLTLLINKTKNDFGALLYYDLISSQISLNIQCAPSPKKVLNRLTLIPFLCCSKFFLFCSLKEIYVNVVLVEFLFWFIYFILFFFTQRYNAAELNFCFKYRKVEGGWFFVWWGISYWVFWPAGWKWRAKLI